MEKEFEIHNLEEPYYLIGMEILQNLGDGSLTLSQKQYVTKILEWHQMSESKPVTPMDLVLPQVRSGQVRSGLFLPDL